MQTALSLLQTDVKKLKQECIPFYLSTKQENYKGSKLTEEGYLVSFYNNVGTIVINRYDEKEVHKVENLSPILRFRFCFPKLCTLHENGTLQIIQDIR